mmetsp:Transcript_10778/g.25396  ORF Transcript_10778/g.25396 Transcript_10778/m.25396 type:complete len:560 (-) Transcript_10778:386-2065(-)|eukprot:scaffold10775_cov63-Phaeocystis_antarctica.AAC.2
MRRLDHPHECFVTRTVPCVLAHYPNPCFLSPAGAPVVFVLAAFSGLLGEAEVLGDHLAAYRVVVLRPRREGLDRDVLLLGPGEEVAEERPRELHAALALEEVDHLRHDEVCAHLDAQSLPAEAHLCVARGAELVERVERGEARRQRRRRHGVGVAHFLEHVLEQRDELPRAPAFDVSRAGTAEGLLRLPLLGRSEPAVAQRAARGTELVAEGVGDGWHARLHEPRIPVDRARVDLTRAAPLHEEGAEVGARECLELEVVHVGAREVLEDLGAADDRREVVEQVEALLVRHRGEGVVRVDVAQLRHHVRERVGRAVERDVVGEVLRTGDCAEVVVRRPLHVALDLALEPHGPALVEPEVLPRVVGDQVARPGVAHLVRHDVCERAVPGEQRRGDEGEAWVLHAAVGEGGRQAEDVVPPPHVGVAGDVLCGDDESLRLGELVRHGLDHAWLAPHLAARPDGACLELAHRYRQQVRGNGRLLLEGEGGGAALGPALALAAAAHRAHQRRRPLGSRDRSIVCELGRGRVGARDEGARVDGLALREEVWQLLPCSALLRQPLQR